MFLQSHSVGHKMLCNSQSIVSGETDRSACSVLFVGKRVYQTQHASTLKRNAQLDGAKAGTWTIVIGIH